MTKNKGREKINKAKMYICPKCGNIDRKVIKELQKDLKTALKEQREEILNWAEDYTDEFGTFDWEGYGMRVIKELNIK